MAQPKPEICIIRVMFPVESDEQALDCKKKISAIVGDIPEVMIQFNINSIPPRPPEQPK